MTPNLVLRNGKITTLDKKRPQVCRNGYRGK